MSRALQFTIFFTVAFAIYAGMHYYVYRRFMTAMAPLPPLKLWAVRLFLIGMALSFPVSRAFLGAGSDGPAVPFYWLSVTWLGVLFYIFILTLLVHLAGTILHLAGLREWTLLGLRPGVLAVMAVLTTALAISGFAFYEAWDGVEITDLEVPMKNLPAKLDGFTIAQVSDLHLGVVVGAQRLERMVERVNSLDPDLIVITGDLADENAAHLAALAPLLKGLHAHHGVLACTGNHDFYAGIRDVVRYASEGGVRFLRDEHTVVADSLLVYGLDDRTAARLGGTVKTLEEVVGPEAREQPAILLRHTPSDFEAAQARGIDLVLAGHTHGGQIWPFVYIVRFFFRFPAGLHELEGCRMYVTRGIGTWGPPMRFGAAPEVVRVRLRRAETGGG